MLNNSQVIDLTNMSKAEAFISTIKAYEEEYLLNCDIERKRISENEIVLVVENELVVDFFLSSHSFGELISGDIMETKIDFHYIVIQELTHNSISIMQALEENSNTEIVRLNI